MFQRILKCDYHFVEPWWDDISLSAKVRKTAPCLYVTVFVCSVLFVSAKIFKEICNSPKVIKLSSNFIEVPETLIYNGILFLHPV